MRAVARVMFPWQKTFKKLELARRWWHRLAVVVFCIALVLVLLGSWMFAFGAYEPNQSFMPDIHFWTVDSNGNQNDLPTPPEEATGIAPEVPQKPNANGFSIGSADQKKPILDWNKLTPIHALVEMPNGKDQEFVGKSRKEIETEWSNARHKAICKQWLSSIGIAMLTTLALSYLLQSLYRALLYIVYGSNKDPNPHWQR